MSTKIENWLNDLWVKSKSREQVGKLITEEYRKGNLTSGEFQQALREVYTSLR